MWFRNCGIDQGLRVLNLKLLVRVVRAGREPNMPAELASYRPTEISLLTADETEKWGKIVKFSGTRPD